MTCFHCSFTGAQLNATNKYNTTPGREYDLAAHKGSKAEGRPQAESRQDLGRLGAEGVELRETRTCLSVEGAVTGGFDFPQAMMTELMAWKGW